MASIGKLKEIPVCEFEWKISDFFSLSMEADKRYLSPQFCFESSSWCLVIYPNGLSLNATVGFIGLYLWRKSDGPCPPIHLEFYLGFKTSDGVKYEEKLRISVFKDDNIPKGVDRYLRTFELNDKKSELVPDGVLTVFCTLKALKSIEDARQNASDSGKLPKKNKILQDLKQLFHNREDCDVIVRVKGQEFPAHRAILKVRSPVLASTFRSDMKEKATGIMEIEDCDPSTFSDFLCYLYCEDVDNLSHENVFSLFTAADKYDVLDLRKMCMDFLKANLSVDKFCETITLALQHSETELISLSTDFFVKNAKKIIGTVKWQTFVAENPTQSNELFMKFVESVKDA